MKACETCPNEYPDHLVQPMYIQGQYFIVCPLCALTIRNAIHGLPATMPFHGEQAKKDYDEACVFLGERYLKERGKENDNSN